MPPLNTFWVVPGLLGSHIDVRLPRGVQRARRIWFDRGSVFACLTELLRGTTKGDLFPNGLLDNTTPLIDFLMPTLDPASRFVFAWPWDWRQSVLEVGAELADDIEARAAQVEGPHYLICHSLGGMVARVAWRKLNERGKGALIKRIITIGTPHRGSYEVLTVLTERNSSLNTFSLAKRGPFNLPLPHFLGISELVNTRTHTLFTSWIAPFETLPAPDAAGIAADPLLPTVYQAETWAPSYGQPSQERLSHARDVYWPYMLAPATMPPPSVLRCFAGSGVETALGTRAPGNNFWTTSPGNPLRGLGAILRANRLSRLPSTGTTIDGDGTVPEASATIPGHLNTVVLGEHSALPSHSAILGLLWQALLEDNPGPPLGQPVTDPGMHPQQATRRLAGPKALYRPCCHNRELAPC